MSPTYLSPGTGAVAKSPMEPGTVAAGATIELRDGWNVATAFPDEERSLAAVGFADVSHIGKLEIQGDISAITGHELELGRALRADGAWWCPYSAERAVVLCSPNRHRGAPRPPPRVRRGRQRPRERNRHHHLAGSNGHCWSSRP